MLGKKTLLLPSETKNVSFKLWCSVKCSNKTNLFPLRTCARALYKSLTLT